MSIDRLRMAVSRLLRGAALPAVAALAAAALDAPTAAPPAAQAAAPWPRPAADRTSEQPVLSAAAPTVSPAASGATSAHGSSAPPGGVAVAGGDIGRPARGGAVARAGVGPRSLGDREGAAREGAVARRAAPAAAIRVLIDPATGERRVPVPEGIGAVPDGRHDRSTAGLELIRHPSGAIGVDLGGRFLSYWVVRVDSAGRATMGCVDGAAAARRFLAAPPAPPVAPAAEE